MEEAVATCCLMQLKLELKTCAHSSAAESGKLVVPRSPLWVLHIHGNYMLESF